MIKFYKSLRKKNAENPLSIGFAHEKSKVKLYIASNNVGYYRRADYRQNVASIGVTAEFLTIP